MEESNIKSEKAKYGTVSSMVIYKNLPYLSVLCLMGLIYIANVHYAEKHMQRSQQLVEEIKELHSDYWTLKSKILSSSTEMQVAKKVSDKEIYIRTEATKKLIRKEN